MVQLPQLLVGIYIQRREARRRARNAGRAVYFELGANLLAPAWRAGLGADVREMKVRTAHAAGYLHLAASDERRQVCTIQ